MQYELKIICNSLEQLSATVAKLGGVNVGIAINTAGNGTPSEEEDTTGDTPAAAGTVDKNGLPWDERIHSTPATLTGKGVWRARRGVNPQLVAQVEAELRARTAPQVQQSMMQQPAPVQQPMQPAVPQQQPPQTFQQPMQQPAPVQQFQQPMQQQPMQQPAPVQQPMMQQPQGVQFPPEPAQYDFNSFMQRLQMLLNEKDAAGAPLVDANYLNSVANFVGQAFQQPVTAITDLQGNQQMLDYALQTMRNQGRWK